MASVSEAGKELIRVIRGLPNFPRNSQPNLAQYISERPEPTRTVPSSKKAKTINKGKLR
jgi:hypothetical protein